jgi:hypothetical protein
VKRWIRASMPGPACLVQKPMVFAQEARHLRRRGTSMCLAIHSYRFMPLGPRGARWITIMRPPFRAADMSNEKNSARSAGPAMRGSAAFFGVTLLVAPDLLRKEGGKRACSRVGLNWARNIEP